MQPNIVLQIRKCNRSTVRNFYFLIKNAIILILVYLLEDTFWKIWKSINPIFETFFQFLLWLDWSKLTCFMICELHLKFSWETACPLCLHQICFVLKQNGEGHDSTKVQTGSLPSLHFLSCLCFDMQFVETKEEKFPLFRHVLHFDTSFVLTPKNWCRNKGPKLAPLAGQITKQFIFLGMNLHMHQWVWSTCVLLHHKNSLFKLQFCSCVPHF